MVRLNADIAIKQTTEKSGGALARTATALTTTVKPTTTTTA